MSGTTEGRGKKKEKYNQKPLAGGSGAKEGGGQRGRAALTISSVRFSLNKLSGPWRKWGVREGDDISSAKIYCWRDFQATKTRSFWNDTQTSSRLKVQLQEPSETHSGLFTSAPVNAHLLSRWPEPSEFIVPGLNWLYVPAWSHLSSSNVCQHAWLNVKQLTILGKDSGNMQDFTIRFFRAMLLKKAEKKIFSSDFINLSCKNSKALLLLLTSCVLFIYLNFKKNLSTSFVRQLGT